MIIHNIFSLETHNKLDFRSDKTCIESGVEMCLISTVIICMERTSPKMTFLFTPFNSDIAL